MARTPDVAHLAERVQALLGQGLDVVEAYATARGTSTSRELARYEKDRQKALAAHQKAVQRHSARVAAQRRNAVTLAAAAAVLLALAIVDLAAAAMPGDPWIWFVAAALAAVLAVRSKWEADHATAPDPAAYAPALRLDERALRREAIGWAEAQELAAAKRQLVGMVPAISALHPDAGRDLAAADQHAGPVLVAQVTRLALLDQVARELPGTGAAAAAQSAAEQVRTRLADGTALYDRLLAAASTMLAAPDLGQSTTAILGPAADALTAYAHGLAAASDE